MKKLCLLIAPLGIASICFAQDRAPVSRFAIDLNDTNDIRVIDGVISKEKYTEDKFSIYHLSGEDQVKLGLQSKKSVTVINTLNTPVEGYIYSQVRDSFLASDLPYYAKMAIAMNGKVLSAEDRKHLYPRMQESHVKRTAFINRLAAQKRYSNAPFGVIEVVYDGPVGDK